LGNAAQPLRDIQDPEVRADGPFALTEGWWTRHQLPSRFVYWGIHAACLLVFVVGVTGGDLLLLAATFFVRMFGITGGYHRYFAHKTYKTGRAFQFALALIGCSATQKGPLWWAGHHRGHHKYTDQAGKDVHSPVDGFYYAHQGWIFDRRWDETPQDQIREFAKYPELVWLNRWYPVPPALMALLLFAFGGLSALIWGFVLSTVLLWHTTYAINSICHTWGRRVYDTPDTSRNNWLFGLLALGEGWHNNHHHYCASTRQGFRWWEVDVTYYALKGFEKLGLVWDLREPPAHVVNAGARRGRDLPKAA
jgi:stearoyl-CoA desaturase (delta-9 desaturase)